MKTTEITIKALKFENGHLLIGVDNNKYFVKTEDGILIYNTSEMLEIYNFSDKE